MSETPVGSPIDRGLYARVLRRGLHIILLPAVLGALLGLGLSLIIPPAYAAHTRVLVTAIPGATTVVGGRTESGVNLDTEAQLVTSNEVAAPVADSVQREIPEVRKRTAVTVPPNSAILLITYTDSTPKRAVTGADELAASYLEQRVKASAAQRQESADKISAELGSARRQLAEAQDAAAQTKENSVKSTLAQLDVKAKLDRIAALQATLDGLTAVPASVGTIIEPARTPTGASLPNRKLLIASLGALGLLIGLSLALLRERSNSAINSADDVMRELHVPLLGRIDASRRLLREEQVDHIRRQVVDLIPAGTGCECVGQDLDLVHAAIAEIDPPPVPRPIQGERYALLVLHPSAARSGPTRAVMDNVTNRGYRFVGAMFMREREDADTEPVSLDAQGAADPS